MTTFNTPICIVGAGPAGSTASLFLSKYGIPHILTDRQSFPRDKVCGEQFSGRISHVLRELNPEWEAEMIVKGILYKSRDVYFSLQPENKMARLHFNENSSPTLKAKRTLFDNFLYIKAKESSFVKCLENTYLTHFEKVTDGVLIYDKTKSVHIKAQLVLFCTGEKTGFLRQFLGKQYSDKGDEFIFLRRYYKPAQPNVSNGFSTEMYIVTKPLRHVMFINPISDNLTMVEMGIFKPLAKKYNGRLDDLMDTSLNTIDNLRGRFTLYNMVEKTKGSSILLGKNPRLMSSDKMLLVGSAIGSIHPITGYGVGHAMRSGQLAAFWAAESVKANDYSATFLKQYDKNILKRMKFDFRFGAVVHFVYQNLRFVLPFLRLFLVSKWFISAVTHPFFYRNAINPFFYVKQMFKQEKTT